MNAAQYFTVKRIDIQCLETQESIICIFLPRKRQRIKDPFCMYFRPLCNVAGLIGMGDPKSLLTASAALNAFHVPVVAVSPGFYHGVGGAHHQNILTTAPALAGQARVAGISHTTL